MRQPGGQLAQRSHLVIAEPIAFGRLQPLDDLRDPLGEVRDCRIELGEIVRRDNFNRADNLVERPQGATNGDA